MTSATANRWNHVKSAVVRPSEFAGSCNSILYSSGSPGSRSSRERSLRWNSREDITVTEENVDQKVVEVAQHAQQRRHTVSTTITPSNVYRSSYKPSTSSPSTPSLLQQQQQQRGAGAGGKSILVYIASPRSSPGSGLQSPPASRRQDSSSSPLRKGESVRRRRSRVSVDFDALHFLSSGSSPRLQQQQEQSSPSSTLPFNAIATQSASMSLRSLPSFEEILNQRTSIPTSGSAAAASEAISKGIRVRDREDESHIDISTNSNDGAAAGGRGEFECNTAKTGSDELEDRELGTFQMNSNSKEQKPSVVLLELPPSLRGSRSRSSRFSSSGSTTERTKEGSRERRIDISPTPGPAAAAQELRIQDSPVHDDVIDPMPSFRNSKITEVKPKAKEDSEEEGEGEAHTDDLNSKYQGLGGVRTSGIESSSMSSSPGTRTIRRTQQRQQEQFTRIRTREFEPPGAAPVTRYHQHGDDQPCIISDYTSSSSDDDHQEGKVHKSSSRQFSVQKKSNQQPSGFRFGGLIEETARRHTGRNSKTVLPVLPGFTSSVNNTSSAPGLRTRSRIPQSLRKALDSSRVRISGLSSISSSSCRGLSIVEDVLDSSRSKLASFGCRPSSNSHGASNNNIDLERISRGRRGAESTTLQQLFVKTSGLQSNHGATSSPGGKSFRKWVTDQFQFVGVGGGGSRRFKDGVMVVTSRNSPPLLNEDNNLQEEADFVDVDPPLRLRQQLPQENSNHHRSAAAAAARNINPENQQILDHPLRELPRNNFHFQNHDVGETRETSGETRDICGETRRTHGETQCGNSKRHLKKDHGVHHREDDCHERKKGSSRRHSVMINHSGPLKFQGLQHLFGAADPSSKPSSQKSVGFRTNSDLIHGEELKTVKAMQFLDFSEVAELNEFLRAKRDSVTSCQRNGSGYLKFISTPSPIDFGSMICTICYSYFLEKRRKGSGRWSVVPLINFSRWRMRQHLDAAWLFHVCGLDVKALMFADEVDIEGLSRDGVTTRTMFVGDQVLRKTDDIGSCCTLLAETFSRDADEPWIRSGSILKTLMLAGLLVDTENLSKSMSSSITSRDRQMLLHLLTGSAPLDPFSFYERMISVHTDPKVLSMAKNDYGAAAEEQRADDDSFLSSYPPPPPSAKMINKNGTCRKVLSPKGSPLFSCSEADDYSRSFGSPTSGSSPWVRSHSSSSPDNTLEPLPSKSAAAYRTLSSLSRSTRLPEGASVRHCQLFVPDRRLFSS